MAANPIVDAYTDHELRDMVAMAWGRRVDRYSEERAGLVAAGTPRRKIEMYQIGG